MRFKELQLRLRNSDIECQADVPLSEHTTFRIGGPARLMACPKSAIQMVTCVKLAQDFEVPFFVMGNGSNLLVGSGGFPGLVVKTERMEQVSWLEPRVVQAEAGISLARLSALTMKRTLTGMEFAQGIPGTLGGAVFMNAGAYEGQMADLVVCTQYLDASGQVKELNREEHRFGYRDSVFKHKPDWIILRSTLRLEQGKAPEISAKAADYAARRREKQPLNLPSAGSVYKRPEGSYAGKLIEDCGLRGYRVGDAQVSEKHCGFIVNAGSATADDVLRLMAHIEETVRQTTGISLEREVRII